MSGITVSVGLHPYEGSDGECSRSLFQLLVGCQRYFSPEGKGFIFLSNHSLTSKFCFFFNWSVVWGSQVALVVRNSLAKAGDVRDSDHDQTHVRSLGQEDPLKGMATHSSILAWSILWTEEPDGLQSVGSQRFRHD